MDLRPSASSHLLRRIGFSSLKTTITTSGRTFLINDATRALLRLCGPVDRFLLRSRCSLLFFRCYACRLRAPPMILHRLCTSHPLTTLKFSHLNTPRGFRQHIARAPGIPAVMPLWLPSVAKATLGEECSALFRNSSTDARHAKSLAAIIPHWSLLLGKFPRQLASAAVGTLTCPALIQSALCEVIAS
jgi:hypothetical protein